MHSARTSILGLSMALAAACGGGEGREETEATHSAALETVSADAAKFSVPLWPDGHIWYRFDSDVDLGIAATIGAAMNQWEAVTGGVIDFTPCAVCPEGQFLRIRRNVDNEGGGACSIGRTSSPSLRFRRIPSGDAADDLSLALHELGHCIGLRHEHERADWDRWLLEIGGWTPGGTSSQSGSPLLGNYDYDSVMHYRSRDESNVLRFRDRENQEFGRGLVISPHDVSRVLQYYARVALGPWGFFRSLASVPSSADSPPNPDLAPGVSVVGSPAVSRQSAGNLDVFVRGSNDHMYTMPIRAGQAGAWASLGCCFGSDPAAVSWGNGRVDVVAIGSSSGKLMRSAFASGAWGPWNYVQGGAPAGGLRPAPGGGYLGPAITTRGPGTIDVFVVRADGRLASVHEAGAGWGSWHTHGSQYTVAARPAAIAVSSSKIQLALNRAGSPSLGYLYEPTLSVTGTAPSGFAMGSFKGLVTAGTPPALARRDHPTDNYRVLAMNSAGRLAHRFATSAAWREIGGIPAAGTAPAVVATSAYGAVFVMNGTEARACDETCTTGTPGTVIQAGGLWIREIE